MEKAFPAIVTKAKSQRVNSLMRSRAPTDRTPPQSRKHLPAQRAGQVPQVHQGAQRPGRQERQFSYYVCQSIMKRGKDACETPRLNARRFEELVIGKIRSNVLTEGTIRALVKVVAEQMDAWPASSARGWRPSRMSLRT